MHLPRIGHRLRRGAHIRLGNDFHQGRTGAVQINARHAGKIFVQTFARILFQMRAGQADGFLDGGLAFAQSHRDRATGHNRLRQLADLIALGQIRVKVIFSIKRAVLRHFGTNRKAEQRGHAHRFGIQHRQNTGQTQIHRASLHIRRGTKRRGRTGKNFGLRGQLRMNFQTDHGLPT